MIRFGGRVSSCQSLQALSESERNLARAAHQAKNSISDTFVTKQRQSPTQLNCTRFPRCMVPLLHCQPERLLISPRTLRHASTGFEAAVIGLPTTMKSAPALIASRGVIIRF